MWIGPQLEYFYKNTSDIDLTKTIPMYILSIHLKYFLKENKLPEF